MDRDTGRTSSEGCGIDWKTCLKISTVGWWFSHILFISIRYIGRLDKVLRAICYHMFCISSAPHSTYG